MPVPKPHGDEDKEKFVSRCIAAISGEYDENQAAAICYKSWGETGHAMKHSAFIKGFDACVSHAKTELTPELRRRVESGIAEAERKLQKELSYSKDLQDKKIVADYEKYLNKMYAALKDGYLDV